MSAEIISALKAMKLHGMASNYPEVAAQARHTDFTPEAFLTQLLKAETAERAVRSMAYQMGAARFPAHRDLAGFEFGQANVDEGLVRALHAGKFIEVAHNAVLIGGPGAGKSWLACAMAQYARRRGHSAYYQRVPRLGEELRIRHGNGTFGKWLIQLAKTDVLLLDDWGMAALDAQARADLLEIIDDRAANKATIITSQLPIEHWHAWVGDATIADAILDRLMQRNHRFTLTGESLRQKPKINKQEKNQVPS